MAICWLLHVSERNLQDGWTVDSIHRSGSLCSRSLCSLSLAIFSQVFGCTSIQGTSAGSIEYNVKINVFAPFSTRMWDQGNCLLSCVLKDRLKVKFALAWQVQQTLFRTAVRIVAKPVTLLLSISPLLDAFCCCSLKITIRINLPGEMFTQTTVLSLLRVIYACIQFIVLCFQACQF